MGQAKKKMMEEEDMYNNAELENFFKVQLEKETLINNSAIEGIAKQLTTQGAASLKGNQKPAIESYLATYKSNVKCDNCSNGNVSSLSDYLFIEDNEYGLCPICEYDRQKFMAD